MLKLQWMALAAMMSVHQFATTCPIPIVATATMNVEHATYDFSGLDQVTLTIFAMDSTAPSQITLAYGSDKVVSLEIVGSDIYDGVLYYWAYLPGSSANEERFSISLSETSKDGQKSWAASVRHGFGWCGTMDSTMELVGVPIYYNN